MKSVMKRTSIMLVIVSLVMAFVSLQCGFFKTSPLWTETPNPLITYIASTVQTSMTLTQSAQMQPAVAETVMPTVAGDDRLENWLVITTSRGIYLASEDGQRINRVSTQLVIGPHTSGGLLTAVSPLGDRLAIVGAENFYNRDATLYMLSDDGGLQTIMRLTPQEMLDYKDELCDPQNEALRAVGMGGAVAWRPDGSKLAYVGAQDGGTASVYSYDISSRQNTRLASSTGSFYDVFWSPDGNWLLGYSADCFGTGAGFDMDGVYKIDAATGSMSAAYPLSEYSSGEDFLGWAGGHIALLSSYDPNVGLRSLFALDLETGEKIAILNDFFYKFATSVEGVVAVAVDPDYANDPERDGLLLFKSDGSLLYHLPDVYVLDVAFSDALGQFLMLTTAGEIFRVPLDGSDATLLTQGTDLPVFAADGKTWVNYAADGVYIQTLDGSKTLLSPLQGTDAVWTPDGSLFITLGEDVYGDATTVFFALTPQAEALVPLLVDVNPMFVPVWLGLP